MLSKLRIDVEQASQWSAMEVARRWMTLYPPRGSDRKPLKVTDAFLKLKAENVAWVEETRKRLLKLNGTRLLGRFLASSRDRRKQ